MTTEVTTIAGVETPVSPFRVALVSTYDLGRQPFGLASPAAWLRDAGIDVQCHDLAVDACDAGALASADLVAFHVPMHTATRLALRVAAQVRGLNPRVRLCFFGLYAASHGDVLRAAGADYLLGGEFEAALVHLAERMRAAAGGFVEQVEPDVSLDRLEFRVPDRSTLPRLDRYARLVLGEGRSRTVGTVEASRGCKHLCRHCPIVPVYRGRFRIVSRDVVLEDVRRQVAAGAEHVTFADPDFWNGIGHAVPIVRALHAEHPHLTYDATIKIEHLLRHREHLATLRETGCAFVTSAVESVDDRVLALLEKGHTREDFVSVVRLFREHELVLQPTFIPFSPWTSLQGYGELLATLAELGLIDHVAPVQLAIRLLVPAGSRLLELPQVRKLVGPFDAARLVHPWRHPDPAMDRLFEEVDALIRGAMGSGATRREIFEQVWARAGGGMAGVPEGPRHSRAPIPYLTEPWYC